MLSRDHEGHKPFAKTQKLEDNANTAITLTFFSEAIFFLTDSLPWRRQPCDPENLGASMIPSFPPAVCSPPPGQPTDNSSLPFDMGLPDTLNQQMKCRQLKIKASCQLP